MKKQKLDPEKILDDCDNYWIENQRRDLFEKVALVLIGSNPELEFDVLVGGAEALSNTIIKASEEFAKKKPDAEPCDTCGKMTAEKDSCASNDCSRRLCEKCYEADEFAKKKV